MASIGQLAAGVAHEINNPTAFILSNLSSLKKYTDRLAEFILLQSEVIDKITVTKGEGTETVLKTIAEQRKGKKIDYIMNDID